MRTLTMATAGTLIGLLIAVAAPAQATTYIAARGGNGNERCLVGGDSFGQSGEIGKTCTGGGNYDGQESIVDLIINDIGGGLDWERVDDPNDSFFTFLSGAATTQVRGRARYAGYNNAFGATLLDGSYHELISGVPGNKVLLSDCTGITGCGTLNTDFVDLGQLIPGLLSGQPWKPTLDANGAGSTLYTSLASDNYRGLDHMVAFKTVDPINNPQEDGFNAFNYILGFEDWRTLGDQDYNDFVLELSYSAVTSVPEPGAMALFGVGLLGAAGLRRRRVREATA